MKYLSAIFLIGLALPLSGVYSEETPSAESFHQMNTESSLVELEEESSFLEDEFEPELISLEEDSELQNTPLDAPLATQSPPAAEALSSPLAEESPVSLISGMESSSSLSQDTEPALQQATLIVQEPALIGEAAHFPSTGVSIDLKQAFRGSPLIYSVLIGMSIFSFGLWMYSVTSIRLSTQISSSLLNQVQNQLNSNNFDEAIDLCKHHRSLFSKMLVCGIQSRKYGIPMVMESMKAEAKRSTVFFWQKLGLLNDIAIIAPMLGLLGTVLGMFYAFYDVNRSIESISTLFDGLGISVGTTVAGLLVAIMALILHSTAKYRLVRALAKVENEAQNMVTLLDDKTHIHRG